jgi:hypothetical protein
MADLDNLPPQAEPDPSAPPPGGDQPGSQPAPVDTTATEPEDPQDPPKPEEKREPSRSQSRAIASLRRQNAELQRMLGRLEERVSTTVPTAPQAQSGPPKQTDFNNFDDWITANNDYVAKRAAEEASKAVAARLKPEEAPEAKGAKFWQTAAKQAKELGIADFQEAAEAIQSGEVVTSPAMSHYVVEDAENPAAVVAWLAENPEEAERISRLDPVRAGAAMAKVDARLGRRPRQVSAAPAPAPELRGGGTASTSLERLSHDDLTKLVGKWNRN